MAGGLVSGTAESLGDITLDRPTRQWDHPTGWAPHQILAWEGLHRYAYPQHTRRLAYRWLYMITRAFSDFNGVVPEKFNVVRMSHKVAAEYGNVGTDFKRVPREGFAWVNASYLIGQRHLSLLERRALGTLVPPESLLKWSKDLVSNQDSNKI
jgi:alpha,alpha-trehalase